MNTKARVLLIGGVIGAGIGVLAGWLYLNSSVAQIDELGETHVPAPRPGDALKMVLGVLGLLRMLSD